MIRPGEVTQVRELKRGVEARVCLGASVKHGSAVVVVTTASPEVMAALAALKNAVADDARASLGNILEDQAAWDREKASA